MIRIVKKILTVSLCFLAVNAKKPTHYELDGYNFQNYIQDFAKDYLLSSSEYGSREQIFNANLQSIQSHNADSSKSWKKGVNQFTDMTLEEFKQHLGYSKDMQLAHQQHNMKFLESSYEVQGLSIPKTFDWRERGVVSPIKDQGHCGSCWAFSSTECIESHAAINSGELKILSPQQLTSCTTNGLQCGGTGGCSGAVFQLAFTYAELFKMTTEESYPYTSGKGETGECIYDPTSMKPAVSLMGHQSLPFNDRFALEEALISTGPVAITVDASSWKEYESGVYDNTDFSENIEINHGVVLVGYTEDAFIVRNSWNSTWGEKGYIRLQKTNECGWDSTPASGVACKGDGNVKQKACGESGMFFNSMIPIDAKVIWN